MSTLAAPSIAREFAAFAAALEPAALPADALQRAQLCILDAIGIGLAATTFEFANRTARACLAMGGPGASPVIGMALRLPLRDALLLNGVLIHGLDYDDTHSTSVIHCSASAVPMLLGLGFAQQASGRRALAAYLLAVELDARVGSAAQGALQKRGWHPTGVVGAFGCAAAAAYLADASEAQFGHALGVTLSVASGNLEFLHDGAWTKRLHPGWAAVAGYTAAQLALAGFVGPSLPFEGRFGLYNMLLGSETPIDRAPITAGLGGQWEILNVAIKPYPACHFVHAFADAALALRQAPGFALDRIESIEAYIAEDEVAVVCEPEAAKRRPRNAYEAQFSVHYIIAASLVRGRFGLAELDESALYDPAIQALAARVSYRPDPDSAYPRHYSGAVAIALRDGSVLRHREAVNRGAGERPLSDRDIDAKYFDNALRAVSRLRAERIHDAILRLDGAPDLAELAAAVCLG